MYERRLDLLGQKNIYELYELFLKGIDSWTCTLYVADMDLIMKKNKKNLYKYVPMRMSVKMYSRIKHVMATSTDWSLSKWIREAIEEKLAKHEILYRKRK